MALSPAKQAELKWDVIRSAARDKPHIGLKSMYMYTKSDTLHTLIVIALDQTLTLKLNSTGEVMPINYLRVERYLDGANTLDDITLARDKDGAKYEENHTYNLVRNENHQLFGKHLRDLVSICDRLHKVPYRLGVTDCQWYANRVFASLMDNDNDEDEWKQLKFWMFNTGKAVVAGVVETIANTQEVLASRQSSRHSLEDSRHSTLNAAKLRNGWTYIN